MPPPQALPEATHAVVPVAAPEATQQPPSEHKLPEQHGWLMPPHAVHVDAPPKVPAVQLVILAVQALFAQHCMPAPPQVPPAPFEHVPPPAEVGQAVALAKQAPLAQQPPSEHALPAQQT